MIELTYGDLANPDFGKALKKLAESEEIKKADLLKRISRIYKAVVEADRERVELAQKLLKSMGLQDPDSKTQRLYVPTANQQAWDDEFAVIQATKFTIEQDKLKFAEVSACKLTAADIAALDSILAD